MTRRIEPTDEDRRHLRQAMKDTEEGWKLHPFTCARFGLIGWLAEDGHGGWTRAAYAERRRGTTEE